MIRRTLLAFTAALALSLSTSFGQITENPKVEEQSADYVKIQRVELTDRYTVVYLTFTEDGRAGKPNAIRPDTPFSKPRGREEQLLSADEIWLDPETRLYKPGERDTYFKFVKAENIPTETKKPVTAGEKIDFVAYFEKLPPGLEEFDFYEGRSSKNTQSWNFYGIHIKNPLKKTKETKPAEKAKAPVKKPAPKAAEPEKVVEPEKPAEPVKEDSIATGTLKKPKAVGEVIALPNLYFETSKTTLLSESYSQLDELAGLMKENPTMEIRIEGHTDNVGDFDKNLELSRKRAEAVREYLVQKGIDGARIEAKGYGATRPIGKGGEEGRKKNRRVEFVVTQM